MFPKLSNAKLKERIFVGPQIRKIVKDPLFEEKLNHIELRTWRSFKNVTHDFLGNKKVENYEEIIKELITHYCKMGCWMSLKIHFLHSYLNFFPQNVGAISDEQEKSFHQDILTMKKPYQRRWDPAKKGDYCWFLIRANKTPYKRMSTFAKKVIDDRFMFMFMNIVFVFCLN
jgi:hypothetical protein